MMDGSLEVTVLTGSDGWVLGAKLRFELSVDDDMPDIRDEG